MIGRIVRPVDFERVLAASQRSRSTHFAVHYLAGSPLPVRPARFEPRVETPVADVFPVLSPELSTGTASEDVLLVDDCSHWMGLVVPKRHAKRAVTRTLLKRQLRAAMQRQAAALPPGLWVLRLRAPFDRAQFISPASELLRESTRDEIAGLLERAAHAPLPAWTPRPRSGKPAKDAPKNASPQKPQSAPPGPPGPSAK